MVVDVPLDLLEGTDELLRQLAGKAHGMSGNKRRDISQTPPHSAFSGQP